MVKKIILTICILFQGVLILDRITCGKIKSDDSRYINAGEIPDNGIDDDNNGLVDDYVRNSREIDEGMFGILGWQYRSGSDWVDHRVHINFVVFTLINFFVLFLGLALVESPDGRIADDILVRIGTWTLWFSLFICSWPLILVLPDLIWSLFAGIGSLFAWIGSLFGGAWNIISANSGPTLCCVTPLGLVIAILLLVIAAKD